jgi:hypothetical protein
MICAEPNFLGERKRREERDYGADICLLYDHV